MPALSDRERAFMALYASFSTAAAPGASMFDDSEPEQAADEGTTVARSLAELPPSRATSGKAASNKAAPKPAAGEEQPRRMLKPLSDRQCEAEKANMRRVGDIVQWRPKKGASVVKMRVISAGVPWQEPCPGSGDIVQADIADRDALKRAWGKPFDPLMYTILCDMEYSPEVVYTLSFPGVPIMTGLNVYVHKTLRLMCKGPDGRGGSWNTVQFRDVGPVGPHGTHFKFSEFPKDAYSKPKNRAEEATEAAAARTRTDGARRKTAEPAPPPAAPAAPPKTGLVKKGSTAAEAAKPATRAAKSPKPPAGAGIGAMFARAAPPAAPVTQARGDAPSADVAIAFLDGACQAPGQAGHIARSLVADLQAQRAAGVPEEERTKTLWGLHPASETPTMTLPELEAFITTEMRAKNREKADAAMYALRVTRGVFGNLFNALPVDYCAPSAGGNKRKAPVDDFDM